MHQTRIFKIAASKQKRMSKTQNKIDIDLGTALEARSIAFAFYELLGQVDALMVPDRSSAVLNDLWHEVRV